MQPCGDLGDNSGHERDLKGTGVRDAERCEKDLWRGEGRNKGLA